MVSFFLKDIEFSCGICSLIIAGRNKTMNKSRMFPCSEIVFENCLVKEIPKMFRRASEL